MSTLLHLLSSILPSIPSQAQSDAAYVAAATDLPDLENRLRDVDGRGRDNWSPIAFGLYVR